MSPSTATGLERREFASELKFVVTPAMAEAIREWAREHLAPDPHASGAHGDTYRVTSVYFDTTDFAIYRRDGWRRFSKFRVRRYGAGALFLERKLKAAGRVAKHRTAIAPAELAHLNGTPPATSWPGAWFRTKTIARRLQPVCQIDYDRTARVLATAAGPIRLTLDERLRAALAKGHQFDEVSAHLKLTDQVIMELKFRRDVPVLFRDLVGGFNLVPQSFSKYRAAVQTLGLAPTQEIVAAAAPTRAGVSVPCPTS